MSPEVIERAVSELTATYGETVRCIQEGGQSSHGSTALSCMTPVRLRAQKFSSC